MKKIIRVSLMVLIILCLINTNISALENKTKHDISLIEIDPDEKTDYQKRFVISVLDTSSDIYKDRFFYNFDVSDDNRCAVFFDSATVVIFDSKGKVEKILQFDENILNTRTPMNTIIRWNGKNLELFWSPVVCLFTSDGEVLDIFKYETENIPNRVSARTSVEINDYTYQAKYSKFWIYFLGGNRYDTLVRTDKNLGKEEKLFESKGLIPEVTVILIVFVIIVQSFLLFILFVCLRYIKKRHNHQSQSQTIRGRFYQSGDGSLIDR